jgi:hypothetical protein
MINFRGCSAQGIAVANGVTTLALLEQLVERKILSGPFLEAASNVSNRASMFTG